MTLAEVQVKWSVILMDRLGPDIFSTLDMFCSVRVLNEINGGREKSTSIGGCVLLRGC